MSEENENLRDQAGRDGLTDLLNRRMFGIAIEQRIKTSKPFGFLFIDVESFSEVNGRLRHVGRDEVLRGTARYLEKFFFRQS